MVVWDIIIIALYIVLIFGLAVHASGRFVRKQPTVEGQYLANKDLSFFEVICSIVATEVSALTFLGIPAFAFNKDFNFLQIYMGAMIGRIFVARVFIPRVYGKGITLYEVMSGSDGAVSGRRMIAVCYSLGKIVSIGVRLFSGSIMVGTFLGVNVLVGLTITTAVTFLYTLIGGLKAVVRADILQMFLFIFGGLMAHATIPEFAGMEWSQMMEFATAAGKTTIFHFNDPWSIVAGLAGGVLFDMSTHGVDQDFAQRLMAARSRLTAQWAIFLSSFISISVGGLFLGVGALLWVFYQSHPLPADVPNADHLFSHFIMTYFPTGLRGLMVAGVIAATMSTLDSTINALCATFHNDIFPGRDQKKLSRYMMTDNLIITTLIFAVAVAASSSSGLLMLGLKVQSWTTGAILSLFFARILWKKFFHARFDAISVGFAYAFGISGVALNTLVLEGNWNWNTYFGCGFGLAALFLLGKLRRHQN
jgi:Na+/proline symporter